MQSRSPPAFTWWRRRSAISATSRCAPWKRSPPRPHRLRRYAGHAQAARALRTNDTPDALSRPQRQAARPPFCSSSPRPGRGPGLRRRDPADLRPGLQARARRPGGKATRSPRSGRILGVGRVSVAGFPTDRFFFAGIPASNRRARDTHCRNRDSVGDRWCCSRRVPASPRRSPSWRDGSAARGRHLPRAHQAARGGASRRSCRTRRALRGRGREPGRIRDPDRPSKRCSPGADIDDMLRRALAAASVKEAVAAVAAAPESRAAKSISAPWCSRTDAPDRSAKAAARATDPARVAAFAKVSPPRAAPRCCCSQKDFASRRGASRRRSARSISWRVGEKLLLRRGQARARDDEAAEAVTVRQRRGSSPQRNIGWPPIRRHTRAHRFDVVLVVPWRFPRHIPGAFDAGFEPAKRRRLPGSDEMPCPCGRRADGSDRADQYPRRFDVRVAAGGAGARARAPPTIRPTAWRCATEGVRQRACARRARHRRRSFHLGEGKRVELSAFDVMLMRQDPPFDLAYITATHLLERIHPRTLVVNDPASVRNAPEKVFVTEFPDLMPPTLITRDLAEIKAFRAEHGDIVMKPLYGKAAKRCSGSPRGPELRLALRPVRRDFPRALGGAEFLPAVKQGDKRIILVDGEFGGAVNRVPAPTICAPIWCAAAPRRKPSSPRASAKSARASARRCATAVCCSPAST